MMNLHEDDDTPLSSKEGYVRMPWNGKWHVNPKTGEMAKCMANVRPCPLGGENHYGTQSEARKAAERVKQSLAGKKNNELSKTVSIARTEDYEAIPENMRPPVEDWNDMVESLDSWKAVMSANGKAFDEAKLLKPWARTHAGKSIDGSPVDADVEYTNAEAQLAELKEMYMNMKNTFMYKDKNHDIPNFAAARVLTRYGRQLGSEAEWYKASGAISSYVPPKNTYHAVEKAIRKQWEDEHPGQDFASRPLGEATLPLYNEKELSKTSTAYQVAEEACIIQGRPLIDKYDIAKNILHERDTAIDKVAGHLRADNPSLSEEAAREQASSSTVVHEAYTNAMNNAYLERPMTDEPITLIDIEATGLNEAGIYIQDVGWCEMNLNDHDTKMSEGETRRFGMDDVLEESGNPTAWITGISTDDLRGRKALVDDPKAQKELLGVLTKHPYMAHNANYEDSNFTAELKGYAEAKRDGKIRIIDSLHTARRLDVYAGKEGNKLEQYAEHWGALSPEQGERHLGLEDSQIMGVAFARHMQTMLARRAGKPDPVFTGGPVNTGRAKGEGYAHVK